MFDRRKKLFINPHFQLRIIAYMAGSSALVVTIFFIVNILFFSKFRNLGMNVLNLSPNHIFFKFLKIQNSYMNTLFIVAGALVVFFLILIGLFLSHRIAGPLVHLNQHMNDIVDKKTLEEVRFRPKDFFQEVASSFNRLLRYWRGQY